jgi:hypothetical protein
MMMMMMMMMMLMLMVRRWKMTRQKKTPSD